jgi:PIN domain nuclease of toxin-antitoxin system
MTDVLVDTHVFLWWQTRDPKLGSEAYGVLAAPANRVFVSAASVWEIAIKARKGRLSFAASPTLAIASNGFHELPILAVDAEAAGNLDWAHADPFDRLLVAQAIRLSLVLVTADDTIRSFGGVPQFWAGA